MGFEPVDLGSPEANRSINSMLAAMDDTPPAWWYLSFVDPELAPPLEEQVPGGRSWLGACVVKASNDVMAVREAHRLGINPGGEVAMWGPFTDEQVREGMRNRLLDREDIGLSDDEADHG